MTTLLSPPAPMRIHVGGLNEQVTADDLQQRFGRFGTVLNVDLIHDVATKTFKGFGYVEMNIPEEQWKKCKPFLFPDGLVCPKARERVQMGQHMPRLNETVCIQSINLTV
jgi:hypothetical protein